MLTLIVELKNDAGETRIVPAAGETVEEAVSDAEMSARIATLDDSWIMNEWRAA